MFEALEIGAGLEIVLWLQSFENPLLNALAEAFALLGGDFGYLILLPLVYWAVDRKLGVWLLVVLTTALFVLIGAKVLFERPRPFILMADEVKLLISGGEGFGFPSGHVGISTAIWGFLALWVRRRWGFVALAVYLIVMAWARMYGGVHYPQDVVGGFVLGALVAGGLYYGRAALHRLWQSIPVVGAVALIIALSALMAFLLVRDDVGISSAGILLGGGLGAMLAERYGRYDASDTTGRRVRRFLIGLMSTAVIFLTLDVALATLSPEMLWRVVRYGLVSLFILGIYPIIAVNTGLATPPDETDPTSSPSSASS